MEVEGPLSTPSQVSIVPRSPSSVYTASSPSTCRPRPLSCSTSTMTTDRPRKNPPNQKPEMAQWVRSVGAAVAVVTLAVELETLFLICMGA